LDCRVRWSKTASSNISSGARCRPGIIPSQVSAIFSQFSLSSGVKASSAMRWQWCALARYFSALPMALFLNFVQTLREEAGELP
jgi:hypothetical protein